MQQFVFVTFPRIWFEYIFFNSSSNYLKYVLFVIRLINDAMFSIIDKPRVPLTTSLSLSLTRSRKFLRNEGGGVVPSTINHFLYRIFQKDGKEQWYVRGEISSRNARMDRGLVPSRGRPLRTINRGGVSATQVMGNSR